MATATATAAAAGLGASSWASEFRAETVGREKGKARDMGSSGVRVQEGVGAPLRHAALLQNPIVEQGQGQDNQSQPQQEDANDAYFRQENEAYSNYWNGVHTETTTTMGPSSEGQAWDQLQNDWDRFEATSTGIRVIDDYQFQPNNPYLIGDSSSRTRHHTVHAQGQQKIHEVC